MVMESSGVDQATRSTYNTAYLFWWPKVLPLTRDTGAALHSTGSLTHSPLAPVITSWAPPSYIWASETSSFYLPCLWPASACLSAGKSSFRDLEQRWWMCGSWVSVFLSQALATWAQITGDQKRRTFLSCHHPKEAARIIHTAFSPLALLSFLKFLIVTGFICQ